MTYARSGERFHATGRDFSIFAEQDEDWLAIWRTMFEMDEMPLSERAAGTI